MFGMTKELTKEEKLKQQISKYDRETLENKFISLFLRYEEKKIIPTKLVEEEYNEPKPIIKIEKRPSHLIDFSNFKNVKRQRYLHKTYGKDSRILNGMLALFLEKDDDNLLEYLTKINEEFERLDKNS